MASASDRDPRNEEVLDGGKIEENKNILSLFLLPSNCLRLELKPPNGNGCKNEISPSAPSVGVFILRNARRFRGKGVNSIKIKK